MTLLIKIILTAIFLLITVILLQSKFCMSKTYTNYTLFRAIPVNEKHLNFLMNLKDVYEVDFWRNPSHINKPVEFLMAPEYQNQFLWDANASGVYLTTIISDIQSAFNNQIVKPFIRRNMKSFDWQSFYRLDDIYNWLIDLTKLYPDEIQLQSIGKTHENRDILSARIILKESVMRSKVIVEGGIHAREWISPAFVTYMLNEIINARYSENKELINIAMTYEWFFIPVVNPDGYEYSHTEDRLWRKNRHGNKRGVDLNRNFDIAFGSVGISFDKLSEIYCGSSAFSEKESRAVANFIRSKGDDLEYYISFHSYGQYMILPFAHLKTHVGNFDEVKKMGALAAKRIYQRYGTTYTVGTAYDTVGYRTSGVSGCWVKETFNVPYVVTFELRDSGQEGFALSPNHILPTCKETMDGIISLMMPRTKEFVKLSREKSGGSDVEFIKSIVLLCNSLLFFILFID